MCSDNKTIEVLCSAFTLNVGGRVRYVGKRENKNMRKMSGQGEMDGKFESVIQNL